MLWADTNTRVSYGKAQRHRCFIFFFNRNVNRNFAFLREFDSVIDEVNQNLANAKWIPQQPSGDTRIDSKDEFHILIFKLTSGHGD